MDADARADRHLGAARYYNSGLDFKEDGKVMKLIEQTRAWQHLRRRCTESEAFAWGVAVVGIGLMVLIAVV
jgi:hypothetical protein